ncbi:hypothetical protein TrLO_g8383 [Triparma laevis f. longispina]|uniref:Purple acid phosphatase n=1 Tax=Triparma laevis f. longispina TaxID=1714387 RepID=A0A9W7F2P4_9STRA|nr:hypothetical protein TrLO_g8383 [Triparma laevis f. longispina]
MRFFHPIAAIALLSTAQGHGTGAHYGILKLGGCMKAKHHEDHSLTGTLLNLSDDAVVQVSVSPDSLKDGEEATVEWFYETGYAASTSNWIGYYCSDDLASLEDTNYIDYRYVTSSEVSSSGGSFTTSIKSARSSFCEFRFFSSSYIKIGVSNAVEVTDAKTKVQHLHLALTSNNDEMRVSWTSGSNDAPKVYLSTTEDLKDAGVFEGDCHTYKQSDMCEEPATSEAGFVDPGWLCSAIVKNLEVDTEYFYQATSDGVNFSPPTSFLSAPPTNDPDYSFSFLVYGDMGTWSGDNGEASIATASISTAYVLNDNVRRVDHFGDISYARGISSTWDVWFDLIEPYASKVPYMITIGNHEYDHIEGTDPSGDNFRPSWFNGGTDSEGECSVPMYNRFTMPENDLSNSIYWYGFNYANVATLMLSSEHNMTVGSPQYTFVEETLAAIDRQVTPWVIVEFHRPMYNNEDYASDNEVSENIQLQMEELFVKHDVDLVLAGHYHSYLRSKRIYQDKADEDNGIYHFTIGSAGAALDDAGLVPKDWVETFSLEFGIGKISVANSTHMKWEFIENKENEDMGGVTDETWIVKRQG